MSFLYWREDDPDYDGNEVIVPCPQCGKPAKDWGTLIWCREGQHLTAQVSYELEVCPTQRTPDAATLCPECGNSIFESHKYLCPLR